MNFLRYYYKYIYIHDEAEDAEVFKIAFSFLDNRISFFVTSYIIQFSILKSL